MLFALSKETFVYGSHTSSKHTVTSVDALSSHIQVRVTVKQVSWKVIASLKRSVSL